MVLGFILIFFWGLDFFLFSNSATLALSPFFWALRCFFGFESPLNCLRRALQFSVWGRDVQSFFSLVFFPKISSGQSTCLILGVPCGMFVAFRPGKGWSHPAATFYRADASLQARVEALWSLLQTEPFQVQWSGCIEA